ncbi:MAG: biopolymer transporter ExbD [Proteobacteria bacterium]|nr:biopolymer transporter ExbD [Pseudomonadota bacterium]
MAAKKPSSRTNRSRPDDSLNLTPMIDMITCLMFYLLMFASVMPVVIIDAPLPKIANSAEEVKKAKDTKNKLEVMVYLNAQGVRVRSDVGGEKSFPLGQDGKWPMDDVHKFLVTLKSKSPDSRDITLMPADDTPYNVMVDIMDAARELKKDDTGYRVIPVEIMGKPESEQFNRLFPDVSIGGV